MNSSFSGPPISGGGREYSEHRERKGRSFKLWVQSYLAQRKGENGVFGGWEQALPPWSPRVPHRSSKGGSLPPALGKNVRKREWESSFGTCPLGPLSPSCTVERHEGFRLVSNWCLCCSGRPPWPHFTHRVPLSLQRKEAFTANEV